MADNVLETGHFECILANKNYKEEKTLMLKKRQLTTIALALTFIMLFASVAGAVTVPTNVYYTNAEDQVVKANYEAAGDAYDAGNTAMWNALKSGIISAMRAGKAVVVETATKTVNYLDAALAGKTLEEATTDTAYDTTNPTVDKELDQTGSVVDPGTTAVTVTAITDKEVQVGATLEVPVTTDPADAEIAALSSDEAVATATVAGSTITLTGVAAGESTITVAAAKEGYTSGTKTFKVTVATAVTPVVTTVAITTAAGGTVTVGGDTLTLAAEVKDQNGAVMADQTITWTSSDPTKATVADGVVTAVSAGTTNITAAVGTVSSDAYAVTVNAAPGPVVSSATATDATHIAVVFDTAVTAEQKAQITMNYNTTPISITSSTLSTDAKTVTLVVPSMSVGATYALSIPFAATTTKNVTYAAASITAAASNMPVAAELLRGSVNNSIYKISLSASADSNVKVTSLALKKTSTSVMIDNEFTFKIVNPDVATENITDATFSATSKLDFSFAAFTGGGITIPAGTSKVIEVIADSQVANCVPGHTIALYIEASTDVVATATNGTTVQYVGIPVYGNVMTVAATAAPTVATIVPDTMPDAATITNATGTYVPVYQFSIAANGVSNLFLNTLQLVNVGSLVAGTDNTQFKLQYLNGTTWTDMGAGYNNVAALTNGKLKFSSAGAGQQITKATTVKFRVVTDIKDAATTGKTVQLKLLSADDIVITESATVAGATAAGTKTVTVPMNGNIFTSSNPADAYATTFGNPVTQVVAASNVYVNAATLNVMKFSLANNGTTDSVINTIDVYRKAGAGYLNLATTTSLAAGDLQLQIVDQFGNVVRAWTNATASTDKYSFTGLANNTVPYGTTREYTIQAKINTATIANYKDASGNLAKLALTLAKADVALTSGPTLGGTTTSIASNDQTFVASGAATLTFDGAPTDLAGTAITGIPTGGEYIAGKLTVTNDTTEAMTLAAGANATNINVKITGQSATNKVSIKKVYLASDATKANLLNGGTAINADATGTLITLPLNLTAAQAAFAKGESKTFVFVVDANKILDETAANCEVAGQALRLVVVGNPDGTDVNEWFNDGGLVAATADSVLTGVTSTAKILPTATASAQTLTSTATTVTPAATLTWNVENSLAIASNIALGTNKVKIAKITFTNAGTEEINVNQFTVTPDGGATLAGSDGNYVLLDSDGTTALDTKAMNTTNAVTFGTAGTKTFAVPAAGTKIVYVAASLLSGGAADDLVATLTVSAVVEHATNIAVQTAVTKSQLVPTQATGGASATTLSATAKAVGAYQVAADTTTLPAGAKTAGTSVTLAAFTLAPVTTNHYGAFDTITFTGAKNTDSYTLWDANGTLLATAVASGGEAAFTLASQYALNPNATTGANATSAFTVKGPLTVGQAITLTVKLNTVLLSTAGTNAATALQAIVGQ